MVFDQQATRDKLLSIYSTYSLDQVDDRKIVETFFGNAGITDDVIKQRKEELANNTAYLRTKEILSDCRDNIEKYVFNGQNLTEEDEVKSVLFKVVLTKAIYFASKLGKDDIRYGQQMTLLNDLIEATFIKTNRWSRRIADHYNFVFPFLKDWYSYFLSYTNKSAFNINKRFETLLSLVNLTNQKNQVARFIADTLCKTENIPNGFIDEKEIELGEVFPQRIKDALGKSFSFVQMINKEIFTVAGENWCHREYKEYKEALAGFLKTIDSGYANAFTDNIIYLIMAPTFEEAKSPIEFPEYAEWVQDISSRHQLTGLVMQKDFDSFMNNITIVARRIISLKNRLINTVPN